MKKLPRSFYEHDDVIAISKALLGKVLVTNIDGIKTSGIIVETEAYRAPEDKASHAYNNRRTKRTETMFAAGGVAYVYLCYGMHHLFNVVTGPQDTAHGVLIRAIEPLEGVEHMLQRRKLKQLNPKISAGPAVLTQALGITTELNGSPLTQQPVWIEDRDIEIKKRQIIAAPRIGINYAEEYATLPWRFLVKDNPWVSVLP